MSVYPDVCLFIALPLTSTLGGDDVKGLLHNSPTKPHASLRGTCIVLRGALCDISRIFEFRKTKHTTMISVKLSTRELICNYKQMDSKMYSEIH